MVSSEQLEALKQFDGPTICNALEFFSLRPKTAGFLHPGIRMGFEYFASCVLVSHAYVHLEAVQCPVHVGGITVEPLSIVFADKHGVVLIPEEVVPYVPEACRAAQEAEYPVIHNCQKVIETSGVPTQTGVPDRNEALMSWMTVLGKRREEATKKFTSLLR